MKGYKYDCITVNTKTGNKYVHYFCDYRIQDGILTVFRQEEVSTREKDYCKMEELFLLENIESITCTER